LNHLTKKLRHACLARNCSCEFVHAGGDAVTDANALFSISLPLHTGKTLRLSSCWWVITPDATYTSVKAIPETGAIQGQLRQAVILSSLKTGLPLLILAIGKSPIYARDLFVTYDPRATRYCSDRSLRTVDSTLEKWWTP
jgi:hypothetical protein